MIRIEIRMFLETSNIQYILVYQKVDNLKFGNSEP